MACKPCTTVSNSRNSFGLISYTACYVLGGLSALNLILNTMNKETRTFIWGLLLVMVCGSGFAIHIIQLKSGMHYTWYEWVLFAGCLCGTTAGGFRIYKTID